MMQRQRRTPERSRLVERLRAQVERLHAAYRTDPSRARDPGACAAIFLHQAINLFAPDAFLVRLIYDIEEHLASPELSSKDHLPCPNDEP